MEENSSFEELKTSLGVNIWVERYYFIVILMAAIAVAAYGRQLNLLQILELLGASILWTGIFFMGFVGIAAHIRYYFDYEKNRSVKLFADRLVINIENVEVGEIFKEDVVKIIYFEGGRTRRSSTSLPFIGPFYYLMVVSQNREAVILTCLLDMNLKKKIAEWYGQKLEHKFQFFPFPSPQSDFTL